MTTLRIGLVGCGHIAGVHAKAWRKTGVADVQGVFDINQEAAQRFADRFRIARVHHRLEDLIADADVVDDCSPPAVHVQVALEALGRGRHYLVEKPVVLSTTELEQVLAAQRSSGAQMCVVHNLKYNRGVKTAWNWVQEGRIGRLVSLERLFLTDPTTDRMLIAERHWSHALPAGRWGETLPHELYLTHQFMGPLEPRYVMALRLEDSPHSHTADEMAVMLGSEDRMAVYRYSARCRANHRSMTLYGTDGTIRVEILAGTAVLFKPHTHAWVRGVGLDTLNAISTLGRMIPDRLVALSAELRDETPHTGLIRDFARHLRGQGPPPVSMEEIRYVVETEEEIGGLAREAVEAQIA